MRWALFALTIPIAIIANAGRVTITGVLSYYKPELAEGFFHMVEGWVIFIFALVLLIASHRLLNFLYDLTHDKHDLTTAVS
jgi:exosortase/archaeosortase family protein